GRSRAFPRLLYEASAHTPLRLVGLGAIAGPGLLAVADAGGVERPANDLVADAREVLRGPPTHEHDGVLLQVVTDAGDVRGDLDARREPDAGYLAERGVGLTRGDRVDARADAAPLRRTTKSGALRLLPRALAPVPDQLLYGRHSLSVCTLVGSPPKSRFG